MKLGGSQTMEFIQHNSKQLVEADKSSVDTNNHIENERFSLQKKANFIRKLVSIMTHKKITSADIEKYITDSEIEIPNIAETFNKSYSEITEEICFVFYSYTPYQVACIMNSIPMLKVLSGKGGHPNIQQCLPEALKYGDRSLIESLVGDSNVLDASHFKPAICNENFSTECIEFILEKGIKPNEETIEHVFEYGNVKSAMLLVDSKKLCESHLNLAVINTRHAKQMVIFYLESRIISFDELKVIVANSVQVMEDNDLQEIFVRILNTGILDQEQCIRIAIESGNEALIWGLISQDLIIPYKDNMRLFAQMKYQDVLSKIATVYGEHRHTCVKLALKYSCTKVIADFPEDVKIIEAKSKNTGSQAIELIQIQQQMQIV